MTQPFELVARVIGLEDKQSATEFVRRPEEARKLADHLVLCAMGFDIASPSRSERIAKRAIVQQTDHRARKMLRIVRLDGYKGAAQPLQHMPRASRRRGRNERPSGRHDAVYLGWNGELCRLWVLRHEVNIAIRQALRE